MDRLITTRNSQKRGFLFFIFILDKLVLQYSSPGGISAVHCNPAWLADLTGRWRPVLALVLLAVVVAAAVFRVYSNPEFIYFQF